MDDLKFWIDGPISHMRICREDKGNSLSIPLIEEMLRRMDEIRENDSLISLCISSEGDRAFCSGADLSGRGISIERGSSLYKELLETLSSMPLFVICKVNGICLAGGLGIILASDMVISRDDIYFALPELNVGLFPMMVSAFMKRDLLWKKAMDMLFTGRKVYAREAEAMGIVSRVVPKEKLDSEVEDVLNSLKEKAPLGIRYGKEAINRLKESDFSSGLEMLRVSLLRLFNTEDAKEGIKAFMEKRRPRFLGR